MKALKVLKIVCKSMLGIICLAIIIGVSVLSFWLYYLAPCTTVKEVWFLTQTPGRCIINTKD